MPFDHAWRRRTRSRRPHNVRPPELHRETHPHAAPRRLRLAAAAGEAARVRVDLCVSFLNFGIEVNFDTCMNPHPSPKFSPTKKPKIQPEIYDFFPAIQPEI